MAKMIPLESNPDVMNKFIHLLGVSDKWNIVDVFGLDSDALAWVPRPVAALILLFPCNDRFYEHAKEEAEELKQKGQKVSENLFYVKQYVSNTCGTIALIHCVANNLERLEITDGVFKTLVEEGKDKTPEERGQMLATATDSSGAFKLMSAHQELSLEGQTEANPSEQAYHHFVAIVEKDGSLYELDGRKEFPVNHGQTTSDTFLEDAAKVCRMFIERDLEDIHFTVMALAASDN